MQFVSPPPLPRLKVGSLLPGYPLSTPLTFQAKIRVVTALLNGVTAVEIPNTQWALYPMGGGISAGGAVITAWFFTAPFITAHVDASD